MITRRSSSAKKRSSPKMLRKRSAIKHKSSLRKKSKKTSRRKISFSRKASHDKTSSINIFYLPNKNNTDDWQFPLVKKSLRWRIVGSGVELKTTKAGKKVAGLYDIQYSGPSKYADDVWEELVAFMKMCQRMQYIHKYEMTLDNYKTK